MAGEIFISYRRADQVWARLLHERLQAEGIEAWYDAHVGAGQDWRVATARALEASQIFVLLFSANAAASSDIAKELAAAVLEKKLIIPVRLENIAPKGAFLYELASRNWINAYENTETKLADLARGLAQLVRSGARDETALPFDRSPPARNPVRKPALLIAAALALLTVAALCTWLLWPAAHWMVESSRPFVSTLIPEDYPAFSADGKTLAYSSGAAGERKIYLRNISGGDGLKVTDDSYDDISPSWSSDGARIAYIALKAGELCRIMVVAVPAGQPREAGRCAQYQTSKVVWQPGTSFLFYIDRTTPFATAIFKLDLDTGNRLEITGGQNGDYFDDLHCSPDGKSLVYLKNGTTADRVVTRDLVSGRETMLGQITKSVAAQWPVSASWSEDSRTVMATASGGSEISAFPADGSAPYRLYANASPIGRFAIGRGGSLAFETDAGRTNLARAGMTPLAQPDIIDVANGLSFSPTFAPDGTLAFISNRSGTNAVWIMKPGSPPALLFDGGTLPLFLADFSPDGSRLVVLYGSLHGVTYRVLTASGASVAAFEMPDIAHGQPTWSADSKGLITGEGGSLRTVRIAVDNPAQKSVVSPPPWEAVAVHGGGTFAVRHDKPDTLWRLDAGPKLVSEKYDDHIWTPMTFRGSDVLIPDFGAKSGARILAQPIEGGPGRVIAYAPGADSKGYLGKTAVDPLSNAIIYAASVMRDTNIDLLTISRH